MTDHNIRGLRESAKNSVYLVKIKNMKRSHLLVSLLVGCLAVSCATTKEFPVSDVVPAADINLKIKEDKNENFKITIKAKHLASPERIRPAANYYVVWLDTYDGYKNVGQLRSKNGKKASLETLSPYQFTEILITAEQSGDAAYPDGTIISRTTYIHKD